MNTRSLLYMAVFRRRRAQGLADKAFTLIELVIVVTIIGIALGLIGARVGTFAFWQQEGFLRRLSETIIFLHHQAVVDQAFYIMQFDLEKEPPEYRVGVINPSAEGDFSLASLAPDAGNLTLELASFLSPVLGTAENIIPPPSMPSLADATVFPAQTKIEDIRTMRGKELGADRGKPYILFSPRGFSEFAVIHLRLNSEKPVTILVNPFTGLTDVYREYRDFEWTYGAKKQAS